MWMVAGVNKKLDGPLGSYSVLTDRYLSHYFNNPAIKQHLIGMGLIRKDGSIIPESVYRRKHQDRLRKRVANEALASAIFKKTIDLEKLRKSEIERYLDDLVKVETVERIRSARHRRRNQSAPARYKQNYQENESSAFKRGKSAPPTSRKNKRGKKTSGIKLAKHAPIQNYLSRPYSAPNLTIEEFDTFDDVPKDDDGSSLVSNNSEIYEISKYQASRPKSAHPRKRIKPLVSSSFDVIEKLYAQSSNALLVKSVSPYLQPLLSVSMENIAKKLKNNSARGQRSQPITIRDLLEWSDESEKFQTRKKKTVKKTQSSKETNNLNIIRTKSLCNVTLKYLGSQLLQKIDPGNRKRTQEVVVKQQHCGGTSILVYKANLMAGELFTFPSRRHRGFTFSVTVFVGGICDLRLSSCCEYRYQIGSKLGGAQGHFSLMKIEGGSPCIKCKAEKEFGIERPKHPQPNLNSKAKIVNTTIKKEETKNRAKSASPFQRSLPAAFHASTPNLAARPEHVQKVPDIPETPKEIIQVNVNEELNNPNTDVNRRISIESASELSQDIVSEDEEDSSEESVEEDINGSGSHNPSYIITGQPDSTRAVSPEDAIPGDYESAEFTHDFSEEEEFENDDVDGEVVTEESEDNPEENEPANSQTQMLSGKKTTVIIRPDSAMNRISLPKGHWGARDPSLEPPSYSSDDEDSRHREQKVTLVTVDVHANPSRPSSQSETIPSSTKP